MSSWEGVMQKHAKSFHLASLFFPSALLPRVKALYALCRWLDDAVDEADSPQLAKTALLEISNDLESNSSKLPVNVIYKNNNLDIGYMQDLIQGAKDDLETVRIINKEQLIQYCYKVAGTVGLAMFDLMKVTNPQARANAVDLGIGMQITNICRDVKEDLLRNRMYLPLEVLEHHGIKRDQLFSSPINEQKLAHATKEMLELADVYYLSAQKAFKAIPWRSRGAIIIASELYQGIGKKLARQGSNPMLGRTYLTKPEKLIVVSKALCKWFFSIFEKQQLSHNPSLHQGLEQWQDIRGFKA